MVATVKCDTITNAANIGTANLSLDASGNVTVGNGLTVTGAQIFSGNVTMSGTGARFLGDFSNATVTSRVSFQTSTTNGQTGIYILPNGTSASASLQASNNADPTNASKLIVGAASTEMQIASGINGTGTYLPLTFYTSGGQSAQFSTTKGTFTLGVAGTAAGVLVLSGSTSGTATLNAAAAAGSSTWTFGNPGANVNVGYLNIPPVGTKSSGAYSLATADVGKYVQVTGGSITIPNSTFAEGDIITIFNNTTGNITITCTITTAYIAGTNTDKDTMTLATRGLATILFISGTVCVVSGNVT